MRKYKYLTLYIANIFFFGTLYWVYYQFHLDSFIIEEQFNLQPFSSESITNSNQRTLTYYQNKADSIRLTSQKIQSQLERKIFKSKSVQTERDLVYAKLEKARDENINKWLKDQIPDTLTAKLTNIDKALNQLNTKTTDRLLLSSLNLEKAKLEYELSKIKVKSADFVIKNYGSFNDSTLSINFQSLDSLFAEYQFKLIPNERDNLLRTEMELEHLRSEAYKSYTEKFTWLDFLLFSASNASTVTYGEIIPNASIVRVFLFLQALSCIFLITILSESLIINATTKKN